MRAFRLTWNLRGLGLLLWVCWPALGTGAEVVDVRVLFGALAAITVVSAALVQAQLALAPRVRLGDLLASLLFLAYFGGWLGWLFGAFTAPPSLIEPAVSRAATVAGLAVLTMMSADPAARVPGRRWWALGLAWIVWLADLPLLHQPIFLAAPKVARFMPLVGVGATLVAVQLMVAARSRPDG